MAKSPASKQPARPNYHAEAQKLAQLTRTEAKNVAVEWQFRKWDRQWINELSVFVTAAKKRHDSSQKAELDYDDKYIVVPFTLDIDTFLEPLNEWWQSKEGTDEVAVRADAEYRWDDYLDAHPRVEASDALTVLDAEKRLGWKVAQDGFGSLAGMWNVVMAVSSYADTLNMALDNSGYASPTQPIINVITRGFPLILAVCKTIAGLA